MQSVNIAVEYKFTPFPLLKEIAAAVLYGTVTSK